MALTKVFKHEQGCTKCSASAAVTGSIVRTVPLLGGITNFIIRQTWNKWTNQFNNFYKVQ